MRCDLHDLFVEMIPNAFSWTHEPPRCMHALFIESCWIHHSSLQFPEARSASLFLFCKTVPPPLELPTFSLRFWWCLDIHHLPNRWSKCLSVFEHYGALVSRLPIHDSLSSEPLFFHFGPNFRPQVLRSGCCLNCCKQSLEPHTGPHTGCFFGIGALVFEKVLTCETRGPIQRNRGPIQRNTVSLNRTAHEWAVLFSETVFLWIGPRIFHRETRVFEHVEQHLNSMFGSSFIANFLLAITGPCGVVTCSRGSPGESTGSYPFKVWE